MLRLLFNLDNSSRFLLTNEDRFMYVCVYCKKEKSNCRCTSPYTTPKTLHNFPGQRYNFWADHGFDWPEKDIFEQMAEATNRLFRGMCEAFKVSRKLFESIPVNWEPTSTEDDAQLPSQCHTTQVVRSRRMRVPVYSWSCGHCQEEGDQEPYTAEHYPFGMECRHCGQGYTAEQIINSLAYDTDYEWREV